MNPETEETEFIKPVQLIKHKESELIHIYNKWFDICVTPDHDCFIHQRRDGGNKGRYYEPQFRKPSELTTESKFIRCIDTDRENPKVININGLEFEPSDFAFFMAWFISEGSVLHNPVTAKSKNYPVKITQEIGVNREIIEPVFREIADYLGIKLYVGKSYFEFHSKELHDYLVQLGYSHEKYIPSEVFTLDKECLNIFLDNYVLGDGHERKTNKYNSVERTVFTSSPRLRDDLSYLILLCGYCPCVYLHSNKGTVVEHRNGTYIQNNDIYGIRINTTKYANYRSCTVETIPYDDFVYCVELPKWHTLWVMRDGKTSWNGNCRCSPNFYKKGGVESTLSKEPKEPITTTTTTETTTTTTSEVKTILKGEPKITQEIDSVNGDVVDVYTFESGVELAISKKSIYSYDEIVEHINSLPEALKNNESISRINILSYHNPSASGDYSRDTKIINLYQQTTQERGYNTLTHELAHALDNARGVKLFGNERRLGLSHTDVYEKIFKADNKLYTFVKANGRKKTPKKLVTDYATRSYSKHRKKFREELKVWEGCSEDFKKKRGEPQSSEFVEDFAEATKLYLNPKTHDKFIKDFPNRAEYLESIYGKPVFDKNSPLSKAISEADAIEKAKQQAEKESLSKDKAIENMSKKELDTALEKALGSKERVEAYHKVEKELDKVETASKVFMGYYDEKDNIKILVNAGWSESMAKNMLKNPNDYLPTINKKRRKYKDMITKTKELLKESM